MMGGGQGDEGNDVRLKQQGGSASSPSKAACQCGDRDAHAWLSRDVAAHVYQAQGSKIAVNSITISDSTSVSQHLVRKNWTPRPKHEAPPQTNAQTFEYLHLWIAVYVPLVPIACRYYRKIPESKGIPNYATQAQIEYP